MLDDAGYGATGEFPFVGGLASGMNGAGVFNSWSFSEELPETNTVGILAPLGVPVTEYPHQALALYAAFSMANMSPIWVWLPQSNLKTNSTGVFIPTK
jgi:hypothetical protein